MNEFAPMSQDNTPHPHQRFFGAEHNNPEQEGRDMNNHDEYQSPMQNEGNPGEMPPAAPSDMPPAPSDLSTQSSPMGVPSAMPEASAGNDEYYNETRNR